jgi:hypothetical protein
MLSERHYNEAIKNLSGDLSENHPKIDILRCNLKK